TSTFVLIPGRADSMRAQESPNIQDRTVQYDLSDLDHDRATSERSRAKLSGSAPTTEPIRKGSQYGLTWGMVDWKGRMLDIPRTKNEEAIHVSLNDAAIAALKVVRARGDREGRVFQSEKAGEPLENGRHRFDDTVVEAGIKNLRWQDLRRTFASRLRMKGTPLEDIAVFWGTRV